MEKIKGPAIFLAQFVCDDAPYNNLDSLGQWVSSLGFKGVQIPTWDNRLIDLTKAAESKTYCDDLKGILARHHLEITELASHLQGQLIAVHPAYDQMFDGFAPVAYHNNPKARQEWAVDQMMKLAKASQNLGLNAAATFSGSLLWPYLYPWPQRPSHLVDDGFNELAKRWRPILDQFDQCGIDLCYEIHPGEDLHDGVTFERFLEKVNHHSRCNMLYDPSHYVLQQMDYLSNIDVYHDRIKMFHVKDAEFNMSPKQGVYSSYSDWIDRAGRFRSVGDGQVDFKAIFSKLTAYGFKGWAVLEWECCIKAPNIGAKEGAEFIAKNIIEVTDKAFDDFAASGINHDLNRKILGI